MKKAAVIGASSGIGYELALILWQNGYRVAAAARRLDLLEKLNQHCRNELVTGYMDLNDPEQAIKTLENFIAILDGLDLVIISSGTGEINDELRWEIEKSTIQTNVTGFAAIACRAMQHFIEKRSGHLAGISSIAGERGGRSSPAYNASKAFVSNFLEGLRQKCVHDRIPVQITDIRPGFVDTAMAKGEGIFWSASPQKAARQIYTAIESKRDLVYITRRWRLVSWLLKVLPDFLYNRM
ncbi:MAG: SDR family NAD(P)-dependent oxidoreductase [Candidatus Rifleibacteriota bacterium]